MRKFNPDTYTNINGCAKRNALLGLPFNYTIILAQPYHTKAPQAATDFLPLLFHVRSLTMTFGSLSNNNKHRSFT